MRGLSAAQILRAWERGVREPPALRALAALSEADSDVASGELERLAIGERDARLLRLHDATFGHELRAMASCSTCGERLELAFSSDDLRGERSLPTPPRLEIGELALVVRPLDSSDLAAAASCPDVAQARRAMAVRCVQAARQGEESLSPELIPDEVLPLLARHLESIDPAAEHTIEIACAACGAVCEASLDVAAFLWGEIEAEALRLLCEVGELARGYGWGEAEILAMTAVRREAYLELLR